MMLRLYWFFAFAFAWAITIPLALETHGVAQLHIPQQVGFLMGLAPAIAAFLAALFGNEVLVLWRRVTRVRAPFWTYLFALLIPAVLLGVPFVYAQLTHAAPPQIALDAGVLPFVLIWFVLAAGEEIGWRAYALPKLIAKNGFWAGATVLGIVWCVWHYPRILGSQYLDFSHPDIVFWAVAMFSVQIFFANYIICWLFERSGRSVLVTTLFHTAFNTVSTIYFFAAMDMSVTAAMGAIALTIRLLDRAPKGRPEPARENAIQQGAILIEPSE